jgi:hypothetical protein
MSDNTLDWPTYIRLMEQLLAVPLDDARRAELEVQLTRIAAMAQPLMAFPAAPPGRRRRVSAMSLSIRDIQQGLRSKTFSARTGTAITGVD